MASDDRGVGVGGFTGSYRRAEGSVWGGGTAEGTAVGKKLCVSLLVEDQILL